MNISSSSLNHVLRIVGSIAAIIIGAYDPNGALNGSVQALLVAMGSAIVASDHVIHGVKMLITHKAETTVASLIKASQERCQP
ncbi:MAG: hypothetical protein ACREHG_03720 [Candidatus Saccharimonadales bacterium]